MTLLDSFLEEHLQSRWYLENCWETVLFVQKGLGFSGAGEFIASGQNETGSRQDHWAFSQEIYIEDWVELHTFQRPFQSWDSGIRVRDSTHKESQTFRTYDFCLVIQQKEFIFLLSVHWSSLFRYYSCLSILLLIVANIYKVLTTCWAPYPSIHTLSHVILSAKWQSKFL